MIDVTQDLDGVNQAIAELLEESFDAHLLEHAFDRADAEGQEHLLAGAPVRALSPGYYAYAGYLLMLEELRDCEIPLGDLLGFELQGLVQMRRARHAFNVKHPCCSCGQRLESRYVPECTGCGAQFRKAS